MCDKYL